MEGGRTESSAPTIFIGNASCRGRRLCRPYARGVEDAAPYGGWDAVRNACPMVGQGPCALPYAGAVRDGGTHMGAALQGRWRWGCGPLRGMGNGRTESSTPTGRLRGSCAGAVRDGGTHGCRPTGAGRWGCGPLRREGAKRGGASPLPFGVTACRPRHPARSHGSPRYGPGPPAGPAPGRWASWPAGADRIRRRPAGSCPRRRDRAFCRSRDR